MFFPSVHKRDYQFIAIFGDLRHKNDIYTICGDFGPAVDKFFSAPHQADYLRLHEPHLVPPNNPNGTPPNDHTVSTAFEFHYEQSPLFRSSYLARFRSDHLTSLLDELS